MNKLYLITLEPLETRYTSQWKQWFKEEWPNAIEIDGPQLSDTTDPKNFLNFNKTNSTMVAFAIVLIGTLTTFAPYELVPSEEAEEFVNHRIFV